MDDIAAKLTWKQPGIFSSKYEIYKEGKLFATLDCKGLFNRWALAKVGEDEWKFKTEGSWKQRVKVFKNKSDTPLIEFKSGVFSGSGKLKQTNKPELNLKNTNWWGSRHSWMNKEKNEIIRYKTGGFLKSHGEIEITKEAKENFDWLPLSLLGLYQVHLEFEESAAAVAAV